MDNLTIRTNNVPRFTIDGYDLTDKERKEFDYYDTPEEFDSALFFRFKGNVYDVSQFMRIDNDNSDFKGWQGYSGESYFSGVLIKFPNNDMETIIVGRYFCW